MEGGKKPALDEYIWWAVLRPKLRPKALKQPDFRGYSLRC